MLGWFRSKSQSDAPASQARLDREVARQLPDADAETVSIVAAITGLLGHIAFADHDFSPDEEVVIRRELERVQGMRPGGPEAVCRTLREHIALIASTEAPQHARTLRDLVDRDFRLQLLDVLVELGAADGSLDVTETNALRALTQALGLEQTDYSRAQARHRDKLAVLQAD